MEWWKKAVAYQIYPKSFNGIDKSIGTIKGITAKLDYLADLGIDLIWICPFYKSPMVDNGYDISDYYQFDEHFGTKEDVIEMINKAHALGIKVLFDLILNHTSDQHEWFLKSRQRDPYYDDFYIWLNEIPNWGSYFGGRAFKYDDVRKQYYVKVFADGMPDLNWKNPNVRKEVKKVINYLLDLGIDGFRLDAISHLGKAEFESVEPYDKVVLDDTKFSNLPIVKEVLKEINDEILKPRGAITVGEIGGPITIKDSLDYTKEHMTMIFTFAHVWCSNHDQYTSLRDRKINIGKIRKSLFSIQEMIKNDGWVGLYWMNHDQPRVISHYGDPNDIFHSGSMLATIMYFLKGTPFIYNGEEIGMLNYDFKSIDEFDDVSIKNVYKFLKDNGTLPSDFVAKRKHWSRDNARTIMQWNDSKYAGFSTIKPWFVVNPNKDTINVEKELNDEKSLLKEYKKIIKLRKEYIEQIINGEFKGLDIHENVIAYCKGNLLILANMSQDEIFISKYNYKKIVYGNYQEHDQIISKLRKYESIVLEV